MKKLSLFAVLGIFFASYVDAAPAPRGRAPAGGGVAPAATTGAAPVTAARAGVRNTAAPAPAAGGQVAARAGTPQAGMNAPAPAPAAPVTAARAGVMQKPITTAANVAAASSTANTVNPECRERYFGCMDSMCMNDNENGGRCLCSNQQVGFNSILTEIETLNLQIVKMRTEGVERLSLGENADQIFKDAANAAAKLAPGKIAERTPVRKRFDFASMDVGFADPFAEENAVTVDPLAGKTGDDLHAAVRAICVPRMEGCERDIQLLQTMYSANINADCRAFENALKMRKNESTKQLLTAERELRDAALESFQAANKWDLGQCSVEMRRCMVTTGGCKEDFTGCVGIAATENAMQSGVVTASRNAPQRMHTIRGTTTSIQIAASSYDTIMAKRPLCFDTVTKQCVAVRDKVWDVFMGDIAATLRTAEVLAENNARQNCIGNISSCFQKACQDNIDPNNPEGSFDMCISRPTTMLNVCKIPLNACGIPTDGRSEPNEVQFPVWGFVRARLAAMRVDSCTKQVRECLQDDGRCGKDYFNCIGLDLTSIQQMCPTDKLVGCQENGVKKSVSDINNMIMGIMLSIDNSALEKCQQIAQTKMMEICGSLTECTQAFN